MAIVSTTLYPLSSQESERVREIIDAKNSIIKSQSNVISKLDSELYICNVYLSNVTKQRDIEFEIKVAEIKLSKIEKASAITKTAVISSGTTLVFLTILKIFFNR